MKKILVVCLVIVIILAVFAFLAPQKLVPDSSKIADITASYVFADDGNNKIDLLDENKASIEDILSKYMIRRITTREKDKANAVMMHIAIIKNERIQDVVLYINNNECWIEGNGAFLWAIINPGDLYDKITQGF